MNKERLMSLFPKFKEDINCPSLTKDLCDLEISDEMGNERAPIEFYEDKLSTAIHEAGHMVIALLSPSGSDCLHYAEIGCHWVQDSYKKDDIFFGWYGSVLRDKNAFDDELLNTILYYSGLVSELAFGMNRKDAISSAKSDMKQKTEIMLKQTKRLGGLDKSCTWSHRKNEYKGLMEQESDVLSLYTKAIIEENLDILTKFANALYERETLNLDELKDLTSDVAVNKKSFNNLKLYIKEFYS